MYSAIAKAFTIFQNGGGLPARLDWEKSDNSKENKSYPLIF
jgi:hypothetical protein